MQIRDVIMHQPKLNPYGVPRDALIERLTVREEKRIQHIPPGIVEGEFGH